MTLAGILPFTRSILETVIQPGDTSVDATMGNGLDTLFLAKLVGKQGKVLAYDIQEKALRKTEERLQKEGYFEQVRFFLKGHQDIEEDLRSLPAPISAAMFNLGYLPGGNKDIVTTPQSTIKALLGIRPYLKAGGLITLVIYSGHEQGKTEREALLTEVSSWDQTEYQVLQYQFINQKNDPPLLVAIQKKAR